VEGEGVANYSGGEMELHRGECMAVPCSDALYELDRAAR